MSQAEGPTARPAHRMPPSEQGPAVLGNGIGQTQAGNHTPGSWWTADWRSTVTVIAAIVGALAAAAGVFLAVAILFVYLGHLIAMNRQVDYLRGTLSETKRTAAAAIESARVAEATLQITQRAQLAVIYFEFGPHKKTRVPTAVLQLHNSGHLHGTITGRTVSFIRGEPLPADPIDGPAEWIDVSAVAAPGRAVQIVASFEHVSLTQADWRSVVIGSLPLTVYGAIRYETGFPGVVGETGFAFTYDPDAVHVPENRRFSMANESGYNYSR